MQTAMKASVASKASIKPVSIGAATRMVAAASYSTQVAERTRVYIAPKKPVGPPEGSRSNSPTPQPTSPVVKKPVFRATSPEPARSYSPAASTPSYSSTPFRSSSGVYIAPKKPLGPPEGSRSNSPTPQPTSPIIKKPVFRATSPEPARSYSPAASSTPSYSSTPSRSSSGVYIAPKKPVGPPEQRRDASPAPRSYSPSPASTPSYSSTPARSSGVFIAPKKPVGPPEGSRSNSPTPQPTSPVIKKPVFRSSSTEPARSYESSSSSYSAPSYSSSSPSPSKVYIAPKKKFGPS